MALLAVAACASACSHSSPAAPSPSPPTGAAPGPSLPKTFAGVWRGYLNATECLTPYGCSGERTIPFVLRVVAAEPGYAGSFELGDAAREMNVVMDVTGIVQPEGAVLFTGERGPLQADPYRVEAVTEYGRRYAFSARGDLAGIVRWP